MDKFAPAYIEDIYLVIPRKKVDEIRNWMMDPARSNRTSLLVLHGPPGVGKSTVVSLLAKELSYSIRDWSATDPSAFNSSSSSVYVPYASQIQQFTRFINGTRYPSLVTSQTDCISSTGITLVDGLPSMTPTNAKDIFQKTLFEILHSSNTGVTNLLIVIFTCGTEVTNPTELKSLFSEAVLHNACLISMGKVTPTRISKALTKILSSGTLPEISDDILADVSLRCNGDLRHAVQALQFQALGLDMPLSKPKLKYNAKSVAKSLATTKKSQNGLDSTLSISRAVGKLLRCKSNLEKHASDAKKSKALANAPLPKQPDALSFVPENVAKSCALEPNALCDFIQHNIPLHYVELSELSAALDVLSTCDVLDRFGAQRGNGSWSYSCDERVFPGAYVASLASRVVAGTRKHWVASGTMIPVTKPALYESNRARAIAKAAFPGQSAVYDLYAYKMTSTEERGFKPPSQKTLDEIIEEI